MGGRGKAKGGRQQAGVRAGAAWRLQCSSRRGAHCRALPRHRWAARSAPGARAPHLLLNLLREGLELGVHPVAQRALALLLLKLVRVVAAAPRLVERVALLDDLDVKLDVVMFLLAHLRSRGEGGGGGVGEG